MTGCNLSAMALPRATFEGADLAGADLTSAHLAGANFRNANLHGARLAGVDFEGASLFYANLRGVSFHLGTSRSGLIFSTTPCEGSRTGFYTDDEAECHRLPEEIRKANFCGVDLRGAVIAGVNFYLVDLRGARMTPDQLEVVRRDGAIVDAAVPLDP